jgi:hypothetical protein
MAIMMFLFMQAVTNFGPQTKTLAVLAIVFTAVQGLKKLFPKLGGWSSLIVNTLLSVLGVVTVVQPQDLFSVQTVIAVVLAVSGSAGIHGTWTNLIRGK